MLISTLYMYIVHSHVSTSTRQLVWSLPSDPQILPSWVTRGLGFSLASSRDIAKGLRLLGFGDLEFCWIWGWMGRWLGGWKSDVQLHDVGLDFKRRKVWRCCGWPGQSWAVYVLCPPREDQVNLCLGYCNQLVAGCFKTVKFQNPEVGIARST